MAKRLFIGTIGLVLALLILAAVLPGSAAFAQSGTQNGNTNFDTISCSAAMTMAQQVASNPSAFQGKINITSDQANRLMARCPALAAFAASVRANAASTNTSTSTSTTSSSSSTTTNSTNTTNGTNSTNMNNGTDNGVSNIGGAGSPATAPVTGGGMDNSGWMLTAVAGLVLLGAGLTLRKLVPTDR